MKDQVFDVAIIGGGIAGLSASVCSSSEGFTTVICDGSENFGGQAGTASLIENLLGFPDGISGKDLTTNSIAQARKFGVVFKSPFRAERLIKDGMFWKVVSEDGEIITSKTILLSVGLGYKRLDTQAIDKYMGIGVHYGSPSLDIDYSNKTVSVIGGANSAGQAAVYLASCQNCNVNLIVRGDAIEKSMSAYLCDKIYGNPKIKVYLNCEIEDTYGEKRLTEVSLKCPDETLRVATDELFVLIGSKPKTGWLTGIVPMDEDGFIITDEDLRALPGVFSAGDVRSTSIKRVSCALGEGARIIKGVRARIKEVNETLETV